MSIQTIKIPDIGADSAEVIEILVAVGETVSAEQSIATLESDKASVEVPCPEDGVIKAIHINVGDNVAEGNNLIDIESSSGAEAEVESVAEEAVAESSEPVEASEAAAPAAEATTSEQVIEYTIPDIGSDSAEVIEVSVAAGDSVEEGDTLVVAESDKASVEVPAEASGTIESIAVNTGDKVSQGDPLVSIKVVTVTEAAPEAVKTPEVQTEKAPASKPAAPAPAKPAQAAAPVKQSGSIHAGPAVRKLARELGVDLGLVSGSGSRGRVVKDDLHAYVKSKVNAAGGGGGSLPEIPAVDWSQFGEISVEPMSRIHKATAANMVRNWLNVPHVTQFDDADVTELEEYRAMVKAEGATRGIKMTPLAFLLKACANALKENPKFNSSLHENGSDLVFRNYFHVGIAVATPKGLVVPVIRDVDQKDIWQLAKEVSEYAASSRDGKLKPAEMQGACFTISSLGPTGGTGFTPIVNAPQVGILGVSKTSVQPVWNGSEFVPRKMLPLALSYDHRAINGADAGQFMTYLVGQMSSIGNMWQ